jgi:hypothetical protein
MNNMARKRRRWRRWELYVLRCVRRGLRRPTSGMRRYQTERLRFHNQRIERYNAALFAEIEAATGLTRNELTRSPAFE